MAACQVAVVGASRKRRIIAVGSTDEYEELCRLGMGGFGAVVKARHRATGKTVAIKRLIAPNGDRSDPEELLREAGLLRECAGIPFVVGFHGLVRDPGTKDLCLVMEFVGPSLYGILRDERRRLRGGPPLPEATVRAVMWQLLRGAKKMHARNVVHRDFKTENILVGDDHTVVKICDFGLAMSMISETLPYEVVGTLAYMAPEMLLEMPDYDALVDSWSLGCVMAELITGRVMFHGKDDESQLRAIFNVLGVPDGRTWPRFWSTDFAADVLPGMVVQKRNRLRDMFPEAVLSKEGFQVLNGLLTCNPGERLTAAAALKHPWFAKVGKMQLPRKEEAPSLAPPKKELLIVPPAAPKRRSRRGLFARFMRGLNRRRCICL